MGMGLIFGDAGQTAPARACELCLQQMRFLGQHTGCRLFRCEACALVSTEVVEVAACRQQEVPIKRPTMWG
jgi:hypothetical protein